jgi:hypothetical protein
MSIMSVTEEGQVRDGYLPSRLDERSRADKLEGILRQAVAELAKPREIGKEELCDLVDDFREVAKAALRR